jgi:hypothetical protein
MNAIAPLSNVGEKRNRGERGVEGGRGFSFGEGWNRPIVLAAQYRLRLLVAGEHHLPGLGLGV